MKSASPWSAASSSRLKLRLSSPTAGWWKCLTAVLWKRTSWAAQRVRNSSLCVASSPTRSERSRSCGSRPAAQRRMATQSPAARGPVGVERLGSRIEEDEPGVVHRPVGRGVQLGEERASELVGGQDVEASVPHVGRSAGDGVERPLDFGPDAWLDLAARPNRRGCCGPREVEEVGALGLVETQRPGQGVEHAVGDSVHVSALEADVVRDAHAGEDGDLLAAEPGHAPTAVRVQAYLLGCDPRTAGSQELADLLLVVHAIQRRPGRPRLGDPASSRIDRDSHVPRSRAFVDAPRGGDDRRGHSENEGLCTG